MDKLRRFLYKVMEVISAIKVSNKINVFYSKHKETKITEREKHF